MSWVFFPVNFLFNLAPLLFAVVGLGLGLSLGLYTFRTVLDFLPDETSDLEEWHSTLSTHKRRVQKNCALLCVYLYVLGGAFTGSLPKNTIPTRDGAATNANTAYLRELDQRDTSRAPQPPRVAPQPFKAFDGWDEEEREQQERIERHEQREAE